MLVSAAVIAPPPPGPMKVAPPAGVVVTAPSARTGLGAASINSSAANASKIPNPESRSKPVASISMAVLVSARRILFGVNLGLADLSNAAMAAACGAEAEVPKNDPNPGTLVATPSAAVTSGFLRTSPPLLLNNSLPGVMGEPSEL